MLSPVLFSVVFLSYLVPETLAHTLSPSKFCFPACELVLNSFAFNDTAPKATKCHSQLRIHSLFLCSKEFCTFEAGTKGLQAWNESCHGVLPSWSVVQNYTDADIDALRKIQRNETDDNTLITEVILPSDRVFDLAFDTYSTARYERELHMVYGWVMYYFWAVVITFGICTRLVSFITRIRKAAAQTWLDSEAASTLHDSVLRETSLNHFHSLLKRYIIFPATFGYRCSQNIGWCTVPPRVQSLTIVAFVLLNVVLCSINYHAFSENMYWPNKSTQYWRYISDRTGIIAYANFPIIWLFGMRNNILLWMTGWGFGTYNSFHRWVARVATVEAVIHSIGYTVLVLEGDDWPLYWAYWTQRFWWTGELATIFMVMVSIYSVYGLRRSFYEIFLFLHILLSFIVLIAMWYHVEIFHGSWDLFIWPCLVLWLFDRFLRVGRILSFNPRFWNTKALAVYEPDSNIIRLTVPRSTTLMKPQPGAYYYLYFLSDLRPWENHPFSLAYESIEQSTNIREQTLQPSRHSSNSEQEALLQASYDSQESALTFLIRPFSSATERLRSSCELHATQTRILVEGSYGSSLPIFDSGFSSVLFLVGGTGIAVPMSHLSSALEATNRPRIIIVWAVRELGFLVKTVEQDLKILGILEEEDIELRAYITGDGEDVDKLAGDEGINRGIFDGYGKGIIVRRGRPDVRREIEDAVEEVGKRKLAVVACGPGQMADQARKMVVDVLAKDSATVEYFEESFKCGNWVDDE